MGWCDHRSLPLRRPSGPGRGAEAGRRKSGCGVTSASSASSRIDRGSTAGRTTDKGDLAPRIDCGRHSRDGSAPAKCLSHPETSGRGRRISSRASCIPDWSCTIALLHPQICFFHPTHPFFNTDIVRRSGTLTVAVAIARRTGRGSEWLPVTRHPFRNLGSTDPSGDGAEGSGDVLEGRCVVEAGPSTRTTRKPDQTTERQESHASIRPVEGIVPCSSDKPFAESWTASNDAAGHVTFVCPRNGCDPTERRSFGLLLVIASRTDRT